MKDNANRVEAFGIIRLGDQYGITDILSENACKNNRTGLRCQHKPV